MNMRNVYKLTSYTYIAVLYTCMKGLKDTVPVGGRDTGAVGKSVHLTSGMLGARILAATDRGLW